MTLDEFKKKANEFLSNDVTAMLGEIKLTSNEREELKLDLAKLSAADQAAATEWLKTKGVAKL
jgi:hypothetical protein